MTDLQPLTGEIVVGYDAPVTLDDLTAMWLISFRDSAHTRAAYLRDVTAWRAWCTGRDIDPLAARRPALDAYAAWLTNNPDASRRGPLAPPTVARKLSALSSWYAYLVDAGTIGTNPVEKVKRPKVDAQHTATVGLTAAEATAVRRAASSDPILGASCGTALAGFLVEIGARVSEICALNIDDLGHDSGHRTVKLRMKGTKTRTRAVPPDLTGALDELLGTRAAGAVFLNRAGRRLTRYEIAGFVRRVARAAGVKAWERISPHSFRHAWATIARERGASLEERQYALGHADPRTTQRYDRARASLDRDPSYLVAAGTAPEATDG